KAEVEMDALARRVTDFFDRAVVLSRFIAARQEALNQKARTPRPDEDTMSILKRLLETTPEVLAQGIYMAFEGRDPVSHKNVIQWLDRNYRGTTHELPVDLHDDSPQREWYWGAKAKPRGRYHVTEPYFDRGGANAWLVSVTQPVFDRDGRFMGVAGVDLDMKW